MTATIIITFCTILLIAYIFDLSSSRTKVPSVILLLLLGWILKELTLFLGIDIPNFSFILPVLGTLGLILIVLEGSLELDFDRTKVRLLLKTFLGAFSAIVIVGFSIAYLFMHLGGYPLKTALLNAIPFSIISSAIAIPSVRNLPGHNKEFIIYESSFSDIIGVVFFTYIAINNEYSFHSIGKFGLDILMMILISFAATAGLSVLLSKIEHHIKFVPIILLLILIYSISEIFHLPALIFILLFGLFIGNLDKLKKIKWFDRFRPEILDREVTKFKELTTEAAFLIRSLFFLVFGFLIETAEIISTKTIIWGLIIVSVIFCVRALQLKISGQKIIPLLFVAPRGLITILLFLSIDPTQQVEYVDRPLIIQVVIFTTLIMMVGTMLSRYNENLQSKNEEIKEEIKEEQTVESEPVYHPER